MCTSSQKCMARESGGKKMGMRAWGRSSWGKEKTTSRPERSGGGETREGEKRVGRVGGTDTVRAPAQRETETREVGGGGGGGEITRNPRAACEISSKGEKGAGAARARQAAVYVSVAKRKVEEIDNRRRYDGRLRRGPAARAKTSAEGAADRCDARSGSCRLVGVRARAADR